MKSKYFNTHFLFFSFKEILREITSSKQSTFKFLQEKGCLKKEMLCPGPLFKGKHMKNCNQNIQLKAVKDREDGLTWRCRKKHKIIDGNKVSTAHDVKVSICQYSWMEDSNQKLEDIVEMIYLWSQHPDLATIEHELKISLRRH